jgi:hypothetical protein
MNHPVDQVIKPIVTLAQVHSNVGLITSTHLQGYSISTPVSTRFYSTAPHVPHDPAGTSSHPRMQTPIGQTQLVGAKPPSNEPFPPRGIPFHGEPTPPGGQPPFHAPPRGKPSFASHSPVINPLLAGGKPSFAGNPSQSWGISSGGTFIQPHIGGHSSHNPPGGVSNHVPSGISYGQSYPGGIPNTTWSSLGPQSYPSHGSNVYPPPGPTPYHSQGKNVYPPHGQANHSAYDAQNPPGYANVSHPSSNPSYPSQQQPYVGGPTGYNYPPNPVYGPTGVSMPHQYHPQIN